MNTLPEISMPTIFYASTADVHKKWKPVATRAWCEGSWKAVTKSLDFTNVHDVPGPIVVWNYDSLIESTNKPVPWSTNGDVWQLNFVLEYHPCSYEEMCEHSEKHFRMTLDGLDYLWFCAALLEGDARHLPFIYSHYRLDHPTSATKRNVLEPLLLGFLKQLPHLLPLNDRISVASGRKGHGVKTVGLGDRLGLFADLAYFGGFVPSSAFQRAFLSGSDAVVDLLLNICL